MSTTEKKAFDEARAALADCLERLKKCRVSVDTDYHVGEAVSRVENALLDLKQAAICTE